MSAVTNPAYQAIDTEQSSACDCSDARTIPPPVSQERHHQHDTNHQHGRQHTTNQHSHRQHGAKLLNSYSYRKPQNITHNKINYINSQLHSVNSYSKQHVSSECSVSALGRRRISEPTSVLSAFIVWAVSFKRTWCKMSSDLPQWTKVMGLVLALLLCSGSVGARPNSSVISSTTTTASVAPVPVAAALTRAAQPVENSVSK